MAIHHSAKQFGRRVFSSGMMSVRAMAAGRHGERARDKGNDLSRPLDSQRRDGGRWWWPPDSLRCHYRRLLVEALLAFVGIVVTVGAIGGLLLAAAPHRSQYRGRTETTGIEARPPYPSFTQT